jgi:hypothetical protein
MHAHLHSLVTSLLLTSYTWQVHANLQAISTDTQTTTLALGVGVLATPTIQTTDGVSPLASSAGLAPIRTIPPPPPTPLSSPPPPPDVSMLIVVAGACGMLIVLLVLTLYWCCCRAPPLPPALAQAVPPELAVSK